MRTLNLGLLQAGFFTFALFSAAALAAGAGTVTHLSGTLSVQRPDGSVRILSQKSEVNPGDVLTTQRDSYAQINFTDGSSMTMRPNTQLKVEQYNFVQDRPQDDSSFLRLIKGGLRTVTGLVGKRGNQDAYKIGTNTATIGIRGTSGDTLDCTLGCERRVTSTSVKSDPKEARLAAEAAGEGMASGKSDPQAAGEAAAKADAKDKLERGVYHTTYTGSYSMQNEAGIVIIGEGQFAFAKDLKTPPIILPGDPGLILSQLPFNLSGGGRIPPEGCVPR